MAEQIEKRELQVTATSWMPDGNGGVCPCPDLLRAEEALRYFRIDATKLRDPKATLAYYRKVYGLRGVQIGKEIYYCIDELKRFVKVLMEKNPR